MRLLRDVCESSRSINALSSFANFMSDEALFV